jgi:hypothetical protein
VHAEGDLDFRGTLGVDRDAPVGFSAIRLSFELDTDADQKQLAKLRELTERYCVVYQTLAGPTALSTTLTSGQSGRRCARSISVDRTSRRHHSARSDSAGAVSAGRRVTPTGLIAEAHRLPGRRP